MNYFAVFFILKYIKEFTAENLTAAIQEGINQKKQIDHSTISTFAEQQKLNTGAEERSYHR